MTDGTLIAGATIIDGTGAPGAVGDVLIKDGRIVHVSTSLDERRGALDERREALDDQGVEVIDAHGLVVAPGFIDIHTHSDVSLYLDGRGQSKLFQGVTTEVIGNCGFSPYPLTPERRDEQLDLMEGVGDDRIDPDWTDLDGYAAALEGRGIALNAASLVGHGQLRLAAAGSDERPLTEDEIDVATQLLATLLDQGAFGLSTGLTYVPSRFADTAELQALCRVLADRGAIYTTHARGDGAPSIVEAIELSRSTGVRVQYSHLAINNPAKWGTADALLSLLSKGREGGADIAGDVYPYDASASALTQYLPVWIQEGGIEGLRERLADNETFARAEADLAAGWGSGGVIPWYWDRVILSRTDGLLGTTDGETIEEAATRLGHTPAALVLKMCAAGGHRVQVVLRYRTEEDMQAFLVDPCTTMGSDGSAVGYDLTDRRPHPRFFGASARLLGRYVRELGLLDLSTAVHKMTGAVADRIGITDRGVLRPGAAADVVLFDPSAVIDRATFVDPAQPPDGIRAVWVNGELAVDRGVQTEARAGRVLRRGL